MAAPAYAAVTSVAGGFKTGAQNIAVPASGSNAANDLMVIFVYKETLSAGLTSTNFVKPSDGSAGFDEIVASASHSLYVGYKRLTANDTGNYSVNVGGDNSWTELVCIKVTGAITSGSPWDDIDSAVSGGNVTASPTVASTTTGTDRLLMFCATNVTGGAWTPASGMTERLDLGGDITVDTLAQAAAGGSGNKSATCAGSGRSISWIGAVKPVGGSTVTGTIATTFALTAVAVGVPTVKGAIATTFGLTATAAGKPTVNGTVATTVVFTATASGTASTPGAVNGTISTTFALIATAAGLPTVKGAISTTFGFTATVVGKPRVNGAIATTFALTATAVGKRKTRGTIATTFAFTATARSGQALPTIDDEFPWAILAAPGHDITENPGLMTWHDISDRVRGQISLRVGRETQGGDSRACELKVTLESDDGLLVPTLVTSDWWPNVVKGMPLQFWRLDSAGVPQLRCTVAADAINPRWPDGLDGGCDVDITASGFGRWLDQGQQVAATATTTTTVAASPLAAWPLTDVDGATTGASALAGGHPMTRTTSDVRFGQILGPDGVAKYPTLATSGRLTGPVPVTSVTDRWSVQLIALAESSSTDWWTVAQWTTTSTSAPGWRLRWDGPTAGTTTLRWISSDGAETTVITAAGDPIGDWHRIAVYCVQSGGNVSCSLYIDGVLAGTGTATSVTTGRITTITAGDYDGAGTGFKSVGDVSVYDTEINAVTQYASQDGFDGEEAAVRWRRLLTEAGIPATTNALTSVRMGPQKAGSLVDALRECEDTDGGIQTDLPDRGLHYVATSEMYNQDAAIILDARADGGHLQVPFAATYDDSRTATDVTITRDGGGSRRVVKPARRAYQDSDTLSLYTDELANAIASWRANHGAQEVLRYETVHWDAVKVADTAGDPVLLDATLALRAGHRIVITGLPTPHPDEDVSLILQGWTEVHDLETYHVAAKVGPARLYEVATIGSDDPGDWDETTWRIDSDTSTIGGSGGTTSSTTLVVESDYGWSTTAVPYDWDLLGERVRVTAMTAYVGGQQTATVTRAINGISKDIPVDTPVTLWRPPVIGL